MLARQNRLTADKDFSRLFAKGRSAHGPDIGLKFAPNAFGATRVAFVVSTKVSKDAVVRNRIKRRMREVVRKFVPQLAKGVDIAFMAKSGAKKLEFLGIEQQVTDLLRRTGLIRRT